MALSLYPLAVRGLTWPVMKSHEFSTLYSQAPNFYSTSVSNSYNPFWHWTLIYDYVKDDPQDLVAALAPYTDYRFLEGFLLSKSGKFTEFLFEDLYDDCIGMNPQASASATYPGTIRPSQDLFLGAYIVDNNSTPHLQKVIVPGRTGTIVPTFNNAGGNTTWGSVTFQDQGVFPGTNAQQLSIVVNNNGGITAATVGAGGSGFNVGDQLAVVGGGGFGGLLAVATVSSGAITSFTILNPGSGYGTTSAAALTVITGSGTGSPTANITVVATTYSPIQRNFGGQFLEDVTDLDNTIYPGYVWDYTGLKVLGTDYTIGGPGLAIPGFSYEGLYYQWINTPVAPVTTLQRFYFRTRLESDTQDIEQFMQLLWTVGGSASKNGSGMLKICSSRVA